VCFVVGIFLQFLHDNDVRIGIKANQLSTRLEVPKGLFSQSGLGICKKAPLLNSPKLDDNNHQNYLPIT